MSGVEPMQDLQDDLARELRDEVARRVASEGLFDVEAFASIVAERLEEADEARDLVVSPVQTRGKRGAQLELLGRGYDDADDSLILVVGAYSGSDGATLTASAAQRTFDVGRAYLEHSLSGWIQENLEISSLEVEFARDIRRDFARCSAVRMLLFTDAVMSSRIRSIESTQVDGRDLTFAIWDLNRLAAASASTEGKEPVFIDFTRWIPGGLPALMGSVDSGTGMRTYLAVVPGAVLAEVFRTHGSRLLESNVRTYLGTVGKINKGIQYTLRQQPSRFLAYNNGLTATATGIDSEGEAGSSVRILAVDDLQIVNGGQTTSSLAYFMRKDPSADLSGVAVQMKLVLVDPAKAEDLVPNISRFANSQNAVNEADFFANSEYHQAVARISRNHFPPPQGGRQYSSGWFYERARGQWDNERRALTPAKQREWDLRFPKAQRIVKTDWARYQMSWMQRPHIVSRGAQTNFVAFAKIADELWVKDHSAVNQHYFRQGVAKAIIYRDLRNAVSSTDWYQERRGYLANIVTYSIARFAAALEADRASSTIDYEKVWRNQAIGEPALATLTTMARSVLGVLTDEDRPQSNVTQWAKQEQCWEQVLSMPVQFAPGLDEDLIDRADLDEGRRESVEIQKVDNGMQDVMRVLAVPSTTLANALSEGRARGLLTEKEVSIGAKIAQGRLKVPSEAQARVVIRALDRLADEALIARGSY